ncbi:MAG: FtsX-like permease family protein [Gemmatimonadetes bacterium]|nr:FtsX-like permease family protein [Gemmatimonadota bacterium]
MTVRSALGAGRARVITQLLTENALLALLGGVLGTLVGMVAIRAFVRFAPAGLPRLDEIGVNAGALFGAIGVTAVATLLFGVAPAFVTSRVSLERLLRSDPRQSSGRRSRLAAETLVAGQIALAVVVLSGAGVVVRSPGEAPARRPFLRPIAPADIRAVCAGGSIFWTAR